MRYLVITDDGFLKLFFQRPNKADFADGVKLFRVNEEATVGMLYSWWDYGCPRVSWMALDEGW